MFQKECAHCGAILQMGTGNTLEPITQGICAVCTQALIERVLESHPDIRDDDQLDLSDETGG